MNSIEQRLQALEKANRKYRQIIFSVCIVAATLAFMAFNKKFQVPDLLQAKTFEVVNNDGKVMARMEALKNKDGAFEGGVLLHLTKKVRNNWT